MKLVRIITIVSILLPYSTVAAASEINRIPGDRSFFNLSQTDSVNLIKDFKSPLPSTRVDERIDISPNGILKSTGANLSIRSINGFPIEVSSFVSRIAEISEVRSKLVEQQQEMGKNKGIVMDGRDIGTVVFPDAELKIFMTSSPETRAQRRYDELQAKGDVVSFEEVLQNVQERDYIDTHRTDSPLVMAEDAIEIDNSYLTREEQFTAVLLLSEEIINS